MKQFTYAEKRKIERFLESLCKHCTPIIRAVENKQTELKQRATTWRK